MTKANLPICPQTETVSLVTMNQAPVHCNVLWDSAATAKAAPRGDIHLAYLADCGHLYNTAFDPEKMTYTAAYENSLHFSPRFQEYAQSLVDDLAPRYDLRGKNIVEIGSGQGDFLRMLCHQGDNQGIGFDPAHVPEPETEADPAVTFVQAFYTEEFADTPADAIICRHVLEHIEDPDDFLRMVRRIIGRRHDTLVFFEVPNALFTVRQLGIWDLIYEHCSYFTPPSLARAFRQSGFQVLRIRPTFGGQFLTIEARPATGAVSHPDDSADLTQLSQDIRTFADRYRHKVKQWQARLADIAKHDQRAVIWGTGSKGVTFLNVLDTADTIRYAVDINPRKHGKFVAGTAQEIVPPAFLRDYQPDVVIIMNANYQDEIGQQLRALELNTTIIVA